MGRSSCGKGRSLAVGRLEPGTPPKKSPPLTRCICLTPPERLQKEAKPQRLPMIPVTFMHPLARNSSRLGQRLQVALGAAAALAAISLSPGSAQAFVVTVNRVQYDVTTFTGTYNANTSKFQTAANGGVMPWWGSSSSNGGATQFAIAVGSSLDFPNQNGTRGPYFAFQAKTNVVYKFLCVSVCSGQPGIDYAAQTSTGPNEGLLKKSNRLRRSLFQ